MRSKRKVKAGDAISVYWRADRTWYDGEVKWIDEVSGICEVLYEDGEREELNLAKERYKIKKDGKGEELIDRVVASEGDVSKQLKHVADVIRDIGVHFVIRFGLFYFFSFFFLFCGLESGCAGQLTAPSWLWNPPRGQEIAMFLVK